MAEFHTDPPADKAIVGDFDYDTEEYRLPWPFKPNNDPPVGKAVSADMQRHDEVNSPAHYRQNPDGVEVIEVTRHLNFNKGNAVKYIMRAGHKSTADELTDLEKAAWYIKDEIERVKKHG